MEIEKGLDLEQNMRKEYIAKLDSGNFDQILNLKMNQIDSMNLVLVKQYLNEFGYPAITTEGKKFADAIFYILQHNDLETREKFIDSLRERAYTNEASKIHFALMKDRILMDKNMKQVYGTQFLPRKDSNGYITNDYFVWPIEDNSIVDSLRREVGFIKTVKQTAIEMDAEYNLSEPIPKR